MDKLLVTNRALLSDALEGLRDRPRQMNPKWFYDHAGSEIFERITGVPEYYPARTETAILRQEADTLARYVPGGAALVELGSGASVKTSILLDALPGLGVYVPVDVSDDFLHASAAAVAERHPGLSVTPLVGDFLTDLSLPPVTEGMAKVAFFPGSTLGNLEPAEATALLRRVRGWPDVAAFVLGIDLVKDPDTLVRAYDDAAGVTAEFNRNLLHRLNREAGADFDVDRFAHEARWNPDAARIEMHLVSRAPQTVHLAGTPVDFAEGESIHTENSHKYTRESVTRLAADAGWRVAEFCTDPDALFAVVALVPE